LVYTVYSTALNKLREKLKMKNQNQLK